VTDEPDDEARVRQVGGRTRLSRCVARLPDETTGPRTGTDEPGDAVARPETIRIGVEVPSVRIVMRNYFSTHMLWTSWGFATRAGEIEAHHDGPPRFDIEHRAYVVSGVMNAWTFLEAMVKELFQDAADDQHTTRDGYLAVLSPRTHQLMKEWWLASGRGFERLLDKIQLLLVFGEAEKLDPGAQPHQDAVALLSLRNALIHFRPEDVAADVDHRFTKRLQGKFADNALMAGAGNAWWPDHALGAGCAIWAFQSVKVTADACESLGIKPNYKQHEESGRLFLRP
jgi:hypothetical protein